MRRRPGGGGGGGYGIASMLTGRESLIRIVGKRRRTLSPPLSQLLHPQAPPSGDADGDPEPSSSPENQALADGIGSRSSDRTGKFVHESSYSEWVSCPVCGCSIRGTDYSVNSHLDTCLTKGTKRKLTQRTLHQFKFCPRSSGEICLGDTENLEKNFRDKDLDDENEPSNSLTLAVCPIETSGKNDCALNSPDYSLSDLQTCTEASVKTMITKDVVSCKVVNPLSAASSSQSLSCIRMPRLDTCEEKDAKSVARLETFIVGRKFHENVLLRQGASISVLRDAENPKDMHAIKVLCADSGSEQMLGYLPRELAKYLSPLIDNHYVNCEGSVISLPKHPLDVVPIQLVCQNTIAYGELEPNDRQNLESMWVNVLRVIEYMKTYPPSMTKYQQNFLVMIEDVIKHHVYLFTDDEKSFLGSFNSLADDGQRLFIRLYTRKGPWFRMSNISYPEISDSQNAIEELQSAGYIHSFHSSKDLFKYNMKEILDLLTVLELREICNQLLSKNGVNCARRQELLNLLISAYEDGTCPVLPKIVLERAGTSVKISYTADILLWRVQRLFFLNGEQDLSAFLLVDLGLVKFPDYTCFVSRPIFQGRNDLLEYEEAVEVAQVMDQSLDENNMEMVIRCIDISDIRISTYFRKESQFSVSETPAIFFSCFTASWVYSKVLTLGVSVFEHEHRYEDAIRILKGLLSRIGCDSRRGYWSMRLSVDLEHMGRLNESLSVAEEGVVDPWVRAGSKMALQRRVLRLSKPPRRWKTPSYAESIKRKIKQVDITGRPLNCEPGSKNLFYGYDGGLCGVEQLALQYYEGEGGGWHGIHSESGVWMTIFGLLMWDVIFSSIPDVFRSRFQTAPLDLNTDDFYAARKSLIESHLQKIHQGLGEEMVITSWESHVGTACRGVNWDRHPLSDLRAAVACIGGRCLASLLRHLAQDYRSWSSGMPDLLLWRFHGGERDGGEAKLVEVKGPRDRLSEQQRAWMLVLMDCGFDAEVCKVRPVPNHQ